MGRQLVLVGLVLFLAACEPREPSIHIRDQPTHEQFKAELREAGIEFRTTESDLGEFVTWSEEDDPQVEAIIDRLGLNEPDQEYACLIPDSATDNFQQALATEGIPFKEQWINGLRCVVWDIENTDKVNKLEQGRWSDVVGK